MAPERLVDSIATSFSDKSPSASSTRKGFLGRLVMGATALSVAPLKFLISPDTAEAACGISCGCETQCTDSCFSTFCCTINNGANDCPSPSYWGGYWWANISTTYCSTGKRYYIDCLTSTYCCKCANDNCSNRHEGCTQAAYTNCGGAPTDWIKCRIVRCVNPHDLNSNCTTTGKQDQSTCCHGSEATGCFPYPTCSECGGDSGLGCGC